MTKKTTRKDDAPKTIDLVDLVNTEFGAGAIRTLDGPTEDYETFTTGSLNLDSALGIGGLPRGRIVEIYGPESSGKTTIALQVLAAAQKAGHKVAFIDAEHALDLGYAKALGCDLPTMLVAQPDHGEQALNICDTLVRSAQCAVVVVDSVAALTPKAELEGDVGDHHVGLQARMMSQALRKLVGNVNVSNTLLIFINQERSKIGVSFGSPNTTTGGNSLKYYASVRIRIVRTGSNKQGDIAVSNKTLAKVVKNKCAPPYREAEFEIEYGKGVSLAGEVLDWAVDLKLVKKAGAWFSLGDDPGKGLNPGERLGQGRENAKQCLIDNPTILETLLNEVRSRT